MSKRTRIVRLAAVSLLALGLAACAKTGGGSNEPATASGAAGAAPTAASVEPIVTEEGSMSEGDDKLHTEEVSYQAGGVTLKGYLAYDPGIAGPRPGVLVVHEWWGHNEYARRRARMLAKLGYTAFAVDMYGDGKEAKHPQDAMKFMSAVLENLDTAVARFRAAYDLLASNEHTSRDEMAAIGYCFGGGVVLHMARTGLDLRAVASFHGALGAKEPAVPGTVKSRVLIANGGADPMVSAEQIEAFTQEMKNAGIDYQFYNYEGALHGFTNPAATENGKKFEMPLAYDEKADKDSWAKLEAFLAETFKK